MEHDRLFRFLTSQARLETKDKLPEAIFKGCFVGATVSLVSNPLFGLGFGAGVAAETLLEPKLGRFIANRLSPDNP